MSPKLRTLIDTADEIRVTIRFTNGNAKWFVAEKYNWPPERFEGANHILTNHVHNFALTKDDLDRLYTVDDRFEGITPRGSIVWLQFLKHVNILQSKPLDQSTAIEVS